MRLQIDQGVEYLLPWARKTLARLEDELTRQGRNTGSKWIEVTSGERIYLNALKVGQQWLETIRITGGTTWVCADPVQSLWDTDAALMPAKHDTWSPAIQMIEDMYKERPRNVTRTIGGVGYQVVVDDEYTVKHTLVVCRYTRRVAEFSWNTVSAFDPDFVPAQGDEEVATYTITGQYQGHDDTNVSLVDIHSDESEYNAHDVAHGLLPAAATNPWGWAGETAPREPIPPTQKFYGARVVAVSSGAYGSPPTNSYVHRYEVTDQFGVVLSSVTVSGTIDSVAYPDGTLGPANGYPDITTDVSGEVPAYEGNFLLGPNPMHIWPTGHFEDYGQAGGGVQGVFAPSQTWLGVVAQAASANVAAAAQYAIDVNAYIDQVIVLVKGIATLLDEKLTTDATEITTDPRIPYKDQQAAYVFPAKNTATLKATYGEISKTFTLDCDYKLLASLGGSVYGVSITVAESAPVPPYKVLFQTPVKYLFAPAAKTFALTAPTDTKPALAYKKAYFSSGADLTRLEMTSPNAVTWGGLYRVTASAAATQQFNDTLGIGDNSDSGRGQPPDNRMRAMCIGQPWFHTEFSDVSYAAYSAIFTKRGAAYRKTPHTYTANGYTATQPAIPNTDA